MIRSMYTAASAMMVRGTHQFDALAHNLANANTPGFKAQYLQQVSLAARGDSATPSDVQVNHSKSYEDTRKGNMRFTGNDTDLALERNGFFTVSLPDGTNAYTRNGRFTRLASGTLADSGGNPVMGERGPITFDPDAETLVIDAEGVVWADGDRSDKLAIVTFPPRVMLEPMGGSLMNAPGGLIGQPADIPVSQGYFEQSNVSVVEEMVRMMETTRAMESYQKMIVAVNDETTGQLVKQTGRVS